MPRVLFVIDSLEVGGAERSLLELCRHLRRFEPVVCHLSPAAALAPSFDAAGVPTVCLGLEGRRPFLAGARALNRCLRITQADLLHSTLYTAGVTARLAARGRRPLVHTWVNEPVSHPHRLGPPSWRRRLAHTLDARTCFRVTRFLANSHSIAETNRRALGVGEERVTVVYRGRDPERFTPPPFETLKALRAELGLAPEDRVILHVGRLRAQKGQETLLAALPRVLDEISSARLVLVGEGPERATLERWIEASGLEDRAVLTGRRDDVPALLGLAEVFAFPSHHEGHPGALVEAMLAGCPIVASDLPVHRETLEAREIGDSLPRTGLLVPPGDPAAFAGGLLRLLDGPEEARSLAEAARRCARARFDIRDIARQHEDLYWRLLPRRGHA
jgi:glycosyltransferase involved in cell wall biosynthesis